MRIFFLLLFSSSAIAINQSNGNNRGSHPYEFVGNRRLKEPNSPRYSNRPGSWTHRDGSDHKKLSKTNGVPPYAVLMEPLVQYSQPDPLFNEEKEADESKNPEKNDLIQKTRSSNINDKENKVEKNEAEPKISSKTTYVSPYEDSDTESSQKVEFSSYGTYYEGPYQEDPEPIIEIIIKESNQSLPAPPPLTVPPPKKKKKEPVQVFYVKYKKDPSAGYGEDKVIYEPPIPAVTPPTNNEGTHEEHEEEEVPEQHHHHEEVTSPPLPSTTLKAIIRPDSETYHGSGLHITFGGSKEEEDEHHHSGNYEQPSVPRPSISLPDKKPFLMSRVSSESQLTKRNPGPFHAPTQPPPQNFHNPPPQQPLQLPHDSFVNSQEFRRPSPPPTYQLAPQFPAQDFKAPPKPNHEAINHQRLPRPQQYSTLPQHLQNHHQYQKPQQPNHSFPPPQRFPPVHQPQQYHTINPQHLRPNFQNNARPPPPQQYQTINQHNQPVPHNQPPNNYNPVPPLVNNHPHVQPSNSHIPQRPYQDPSITANQQRPFNNRPPVNLQEQQQQQHQQQIEQLNRLHQQQQRLQEQIAQDKQNFMSTTKYHQLPTSTSNYAPEIIKSISPDQLTFSNQQPVFEQNKPALPIYRPEVTPNVRTASQNYFSSTEAPKPTTESVKSSKYTTPVIEYVTEDPKKVQEDRKKKEEKKKQNVAALPAEVPDDLREQLLSSGILSNADIQILDYDKVGDIPLENLPPEALANFQAVAGSEPVPAISRPKAEEDSLPSPSEKKSVLIKASRKVADQMEMKVVRFNPDTKDGTNVADKYMKEGATQLEPVVLNDSKYNRYLPLKVSGAQFPVPDVPQLRGKNVTSVVVLAPVDYEFLKRRDNNDDDDNNEESRVGRRSASPVLEVQGVHFVAGDVLKALVKSPSTENYRKWLDKENRTAADKQSVILLVVGPPKETVGEKEEIFMYDIATQKVNKLRGELSSTFVQVAESNSHNRDLEEISDNPSAPGGDFTVEDASEIPSGERQRLQRRAELKKRTSPSR